MRLRGVIGAFGLLVGCGDTSAGGVDSGASTDAMATTVATSEGTATNPTAAATSNAGATAASTETTLDTTAGTNGGSTDTTSATGLVGAVGSFEWILNEPYEHDYGQQLSLPQGFGSGEFTLQIWVKPNDEYPVGSTAGDAILTNWSDTDIPPYSDPQWWYRGNFLLDGHNNNGGFSNGTFSLQFYDGGRVRWLFGDGVPVVSGGLWSVPSISTPDNPALLDGLWHHLTLVRRWQGGDQAALELWIDGALVGSETSTVQTDMREYWDAWPGFGNEQAGWFWGAEKQAALGVFGQYEDYKGLIAELRFWELALEPEYIAQSYAEPTTGDEPGLVGWYPWNEGESTAACDVLNPGDCVELFSVARDQWVGEGPPLQ